MSHKLVDVPTDIRLYAFEKIPQKNQSIDAQTKKTILFKIKKSIIWRVIMRKRLIFISCIILVVASTTSALYILPQFNTSNIQSEIVYKSKIDLITGSDVVLHGIVKEILPSQWSNSSMIQGKRNILQTYINIELKEVYKGEPYDAKNIKIRVNKGKTLTKEVRSLDIPDFNEGEEVLLFLCIEDKNSDIFNQNEKYYILNGFAQAKFIFEQNISNDRIFKSIVHPEDKFNLSTIKDEINQIEFEKEKK